MPRHLQNHNLSILDSRTFNGLPLMYDKSPFIREYLQSIHDVMLQALDDYAQVFAFRVDLKLPARGLLPSYAFTNEVIRRFLASFKAKIDHNRSMARRSNRYAHLSKVRYAWAREVAGSKRPHYHLVILLNRSSFHTLGDFESKQGNIFNRLQEAWASALSLDRDLIKGLINIPKNPVYELTRSDLRGQEAFFHRASYLCKVATKVYGGRHHSFGASRG